MKKITLDHFLDLACNQVVVRALLREEETQLHSGFIDLRLWTMKDENWVSAASYVSSFSEAGIGFQFTCNNIFASSFSPVVEMDFRPQWGLPELSGDKSIVTARRDRGRLVELIEPHTFSLILHFARMQTLLTDETRKQAGFENLLTRFNAFYARQLEVWYRLVR